VESSCAQSTPAPQNYCHAVSNNTSACLFLIAVVSVRLSKSRNKKQNFTRLGCTLRGRSRTFSPSPSHQHFTLLTNPVHSHRECCPTIYLRTSRPLHRAITKMMMTMKSYGKSFKMKLVSRAPEMPLHCPQVEPLRRPIHQTLLANHLLALPPWRRHLLSSLNTNRWFPRLLPHS
jgi:hypothetical protein